MNTDGVRPSIRTERFATHGQCGLQIHRAVQHTQDGMLGQVRRKETQMR